LKIDVFIRVNSWFRGFILFEKTKPIRQPSAGNSKH